MLTLAIAATIVSAGMTVIVIDRQWRIRVAWLATAVLYLGWWLG